MIDKTPSRPVDAYKAIIDELVTVTSRGLSEKLILSEKRWSNAPDENDANKFVRSLSDNQRQLLARMVRNERIGAIHDVLAELTWWISCRDVQFTFCGEPMPTQLSGMGLHGDYIGRLDDWEWPEEEASTDAV